MERLRIEEIIDHCNRKVIWWEKLIPREKFENRDISDSGCREYWEHRQVAEYLNELQQYRGIGTVEDLKTMKENGAFTGIELAQIATNQMVLKKYQEIGTVEECREAVERMKKMSTNESLITIGLYFEIYDADMYGGKGTIGYANTNVELKVSALAKADISNYVEMQRQGVAEMLKVDKEKVIIISKSDYEDETADEEDWEE